MASTNITATSTATVTLNAVRSMVAAPAGGAESSVNKEPDRRGPLCGISIHPIQIHGIVQV